MKIKIELSTTTFCGIQFKSSNWNRHIGICSICKEEYKKLKEQELASWKYECECGCGQTTKYNRRYIVGHTAKNKKRTKEQKQRYKDSWTQERRLEKSEYWKINNPMYNSEVSSRFLGENNNAKKPGARKKLSDNNSMKNPAYREKQKIAVNKPEVKEKERAVWRKYKDAGMKHPVVSEASVEKRINTYTLRLAAGEYTIKNNWKTGYYQKKDGTREWYDSSLELERMKQLDEQGFEWTKKHRIRMPYIKANGRKTFYVPDFYIKSTNTIEEMKGWIKSGDRLKAKIALDFCRENNYNYHFLLGSDMELIEELSYDIKLE